MSPDVEVTAGQPDVFSFSGHLDTTRLSAAYRLGLVVVALAMLVLPLAYVGLVVAAGLGVWWHVTHNVWLLRGYAPIQWRVLAYVAPAFAGGVATFFMVKPILARPVKPEEPLPLLPSDEPVLFEFIHGVCRLVGARPPRRVQVDCRVNASAGFTAGRASLFQSDLVLTIGLPLVAGLSVRELGGVLAHEFGHFAQGHGLKLTTLVRGVNGWFARVVFQRDEWDAKLDAWTKDANWWGVLLVLPAQAAVWLSRQSLKALMMAGHAISCFMMRQMEYDADSYEVKLSGSGAFARTMWRLRELQAASRLCSEEFATELSRQRVPSDLTAFLMARLEALPAEVLDEARRVPEGPRGLLDTHPADGDRLRAAEAAAAAGILVGGDQSARCLFTAFEPLCERATRHLYLGMALPLDQFTIVDTADAMRASLDRDHRRQAIRGRFPHGLSQHRPLSIPDGAQSAGPAVALEAPPGDDVVEAYRRFDGLEAARHKAFAALELMQAGFDPLDPVPFGLTAWSVDAATSIEAGAIEQQRELSPLLERYEAAAVADLIRGVEAHGSRDDGAALMAAFAASSSAMRAYVEVYRLGVAIQVLEQVEAQMPTHPDTRLSRLGLWKGMAQGREQMRRVLADVACPPAWSPGGGTLADWCGMSSETGPGDLGAQMQAVERLYWKLLGEVCLIASGE